MFIGIKQSQEQVWNSPASRRLTEDIGDTRADSTILVGMQQGTYLGMKTGRRVVYHTQKLDCALAYPGIPAGQELQHCSVLGNLLADPFKRLVVSTGMSQPE